MMILIDSFFDCVSGAISLALQYNTISFFGKTKKVRVPADTVATETITQYIGIWKIRKVIKLQNRTNSSGHGWRRHS